MNALPFLADEAPVTAACFGGRSALREQFDTILESDDTPHFVTWMVAGRPKSGKTSFANWCRDRAAKLDPWAQRLYLEFSLRAAFDGRTPAPKEIRRAIASRMLRAYQTDSLDVALPLQSIKLQLQAIAVRLVTFVPELRTLGLKARLDSIVTASEQSADFVRLCVEISESRRSALRDIVLVIDDVGSGEAVQACLHFGDSLRKEVELYRLNQQDALPKIVLVILCYEGWEYGQGQSGTAGSITSADTLPPFSQAEVQAYLNNRLRESGWASSGDESSAAELLYLYSGGSPFLLQRLGAQAQSLGLNDRVFSRAHVENAAKSRKVRDAVEFFLRISCGLDLSRVPTEPHRRLLTALASEPDPKTAVLSGLSKDEWRSLSSGVAGASEAEFEDTWAHLLSCNVLQYCDSGRYRFFSELSRCWLRALDPRAPSPARVTSVASA